MCDRQKKKNTKKTMLNPKMTNADRVSIVNRTYLHKVSNKIKEMMIALLFLHIQIFYPTQIFNSPRMIFLHFSCLLIEQNAYYAFCSISRH